MKQFLFVTEVPPNRAMSSPAGYPHEWTAFANDANTILKPVKTTKQIQLNAWLLPVDNTWPILNSLATSAAGHQMSCSVFLVDGEVTEITAAPVKPKP